jgi:hypothetical protein
MHHAKALLRELSCDPELELLPGINCQLCQSLYDPTVKNKLSAHAIFYITQDSNCTLQLGSRVAHILEARILALDEKHPHSRLLVGPDGKCAIDKAIYTNFRLFRLLYNCKMDAPAPLRPVYGSSTILQHHLVCSYPEMQPQGARPFAIRVPDASASYARAPTVAIMNIVRRPQGRQAAPPAPPAWRQSEMDAILASLRSNALLAEILGVSRVELAGVYPAQDGKTCSIHIHEGCSPVCPFQGSPHKHNHLYVLYDHARRRCSLRCHNADCRMKLENNAVDKIRWQIFINSSDDAHSSAADVINTSSLHSRRSCIQWDDKYTGESMKEYPLHPRLLVVCAQMGVGESPGRRGEATPSPD